MSEILLLAAICAPIVLVPALILSQLQPVDQFFWLDTEIRLQSWEGDGPFAEFQREMLSQIAKAYYLPFEMLLPDREYLSYRQTVLAHQFDLRFRELIDEALGAQDNP
jgi:hypothetical protein